DDQLHVDWYDDMIPMKQGPEIVLASGGMTSLGSVGGLMQYAKQGVLGLVALGALGMMLMMVRRAAPGSDSDTSTSVFFGGGKSKKKPGNLEQLNSEEDVFGEATQGEAVLTGIE